MLNPNLVRRVGLLECTTGREGSYLGINRLPFIPWNDDTHFTDTENEAQRGAETHKALANSQSDTEIQLFDSLRSLFTAVWEAVPGSC